MLSLNFINEVEDQVEPGAFERLLERACEILDSHDGQVNFVIVSDAQIQNLNREYRKKNKPTDVLSFPYEDEKWPEVGEKIFGEIFISIDTAKLQAKEKGHSLEKELEILFVHGLLHLMGFDHQNDAEEEEMEDYAKRILE